MAALIGAALLCCGLAATAADVAPAAPSGESRAEAPGPAPVERLAIVDRSIEHHGGDRFERSVTRLELCSKGGCFEVVARIDGGLFAYDVAGRVSSGRRRVVATNDTVRVWDVAGDDRLVTGDEAQRMRDWAMQRVYFAFLPYRLNDPSVYKADQGLESWDGRELRRVKVTFEPGSSSGASDEFVYWFDPDSALLVQFAYSFRESGGGLRFRRMVEPRRVGGILLHEQVNLGLDGPGQSVDRIDPAYVATMREVSLVELRGIEVEELE